VNAVQIELLYSEDCPSHTEALSLLRSVLSDRKIAAEVRLRRIADDGEAVRLHFPGSPTIRIDGHDVDAAGAGGRPTCSCRIYRLPDGRVSPIPAREDLEEALDAVAG
jgi:hypothetical protein